MNVSIRRQGILIKTVPVAGDRARIGSGEECEVQLNDLFLASIVADLVKRDNVWWIVDAGTSLEGVTREGTRVMEEALEPDEAYMVGAFELITDANPHRRTVPQSRDAAPPRDEYIPMTMMEAKLGDVPPTMVQRGAAGSERTDNPRSASPRTAPQPAGGKLVFAPVESEHGNVPLRSAGLMQGRGAAKAPSTARRVLLVALIAVATLFLGLVIVVGGGKKKPATAQSVDGPETTQSQPQAPAPPPSASGDELALRLDVDGALAAWEAQFAKTPSADLRRKIVNGALDLARAHAASNEVSAAARYFEKVIRYGEPDSEAVRLAKVRLNRPS